MVSIDDAHLDLVMSALHGQITNTPLVSVWRHYPTVDLNIDKLVETHLKDYRRFPSDLIKLSPHGRAPVVDFGCEISPGTTEHGGSGSSSCTKCVIKNSQDWSKIEELDPLDGHYADQLKYVKKMRASLPNKIMMMTIFAPTMVARKISANQFYTHLFSEDSKIVEEGLRIVSKVTTEFARASIDYGADGIFAAIQEADYKITTDVSELRKMISLNQPFMNEINKKSDFTVLHIHGKDVAFKDAVEILRPTAVNWHDKTASTNLLDARNVFDGGLLGGINPDTILNEITDEEINYHLDLVEKIPLIFAPGCVLWQGTEDKQLVNIFKKYHP